MPTAQDIIGRARMFEERAERAPDPISREHYREMAAHYRSLAVEHQETKVTQHERFQLRSDGWSRIELPLVRAIFATTAGRRRSKISARSLPTSR